MVKCEHCGKLTAWVQRGFGWDVCPPCHARLSELEAQLYERDDGGMK